MLKTETPSQAHAALDQYPTQDLVNVFVDDQINARRRDVGTRVLEAGEARVLTISQSYDAEPLRSGSQTLRLL